MVAGLHESEMGGNVNQGATFDDNDDYTVPESKTTQSDSTTTLYASTTPADVITAGRRRLRRQKLRIIKNVVILSLSWLFIYIGLTPISSMQSSLNARQGLGTFTLAMGSGVRLITSLFLTNILLAKIGVKRLICLGTLMVATFPAANFYPVWGTMVPSAVLTGMGGGLMWVGQSIYLGQSSSQYASLVDMPSRTVNVRMFGTFYGIYYCNHVIGHVASSFILGAGLSPFKAHVATAGDVPAYRNATLLGYDPAVTCGAQFCNQDLGTSKAIQGELQSARRRPSEARIYALCGFCLGSVLLGVLLLVVFLDPLDSRKVLPDLDNNVSQQDKSIKQEETPPVTVKSSCALLGATLMQLRDPKLLLLIPLFAYNGFDDSFLGTELTKAYITCAVGVEYIGFVSSLFGVFCPLSALVCGWLNSPRTRFLPFILMAATHLSCLGGLFAWTVDTPIIYLFIISAVWGVGSGACGSQTSGICNVVFPDALETTYSNSVLWASVGGALFFGISSVLCTYVKFYLFSAIIAVAILGVAVIELHMYFKSRRASK